VTATTSGVLRVLAPRDLPGLRDLLARDPVAHCFVTSRVHAAGLDAWRLGGELWGWEEAGRLVSALYLGANLVPVETTPTARTAFADRARRIGRRCSSIVGPARDVAPLWEQLAASWGPARETRDCQPLLAIDREPLVAPDEDVRPFRLDELDVVMPACVAMFTEEVGVSPLAGGGGEAYRARIAEMVRNRRAFGRIEDGRVVFKAEVGAVSPGVCQVQGVWVAPERRGEGLAAAGMAAVVRLAYRLAPVVSLYVNDFNAPARAAYARVGFRDVGTFATVLF
jgi:predicted GNAT family acetyltransferase